MDIPSCLGEKIFDPNTTGTYVFRLDCIFGQSYHWSWGHKQRLWSLSQSRGQVASLEWVVSMLVQKRHWTLCWLNRMSLWVLMWYWLAFWLWATFRKGWALQPSLENDFCNSQRTPDSSLKPLLFWGISICLRSFEFCGFAAINPRMKRFFLRIQLV